jgi:MFS family permease
MSTTFRLSALQFLQNAVFATSVISLSTYMLQTLGFSGREVGMVYATNAIAATVAPPVVGWLADRHFSADRMLVLFFCHLLLGCLCVYSGVQPLLHPHLRLAGCHLFPSVGNAGEKFPCRAGLGDGFVHVRRFGAKLFRSRELALAVGCRRCNGNHYGRYGTEPAPRPSATGLQFFYAYRAGG